MSTRYYYKSKKNCSL